MERTWVHRHDFAQIGSSAKAGALADTSHVDEIRVDGLWKCTLMITSRDTGILFTLNGIDSTAFFVLATSVGTINPTLVELGGGYAHGIRVPMVGVIRIRRLKACSIIAKREWMELE